MGNDNKHRLYHPNRALPSIDHFITSIHNTTKAFMFTYNPASVVQRTGWSSPCQPFSHYFCYPILYYIISRWNHENMYAMIPLYLGANHVLGISWNIWHWTSCLCTYVPLIYLCANYNLNFWYLYILLIISVQAYWPEQAFFIGEFVCSKEDQLTPEQGNHFCPG